MDSQTQLDCVSVLNVLLVFVRIPEQEAAYSLLKQGGLCLESHGTHSLGLAECKTTPSIPASQVCDNGLNGAFTLALEYKVIKPRLGIGTDFLI